MIAVWLSFVLLGLPMTLSCVYEACHESLSIYNFSHRSHNASHPKPDAKPEEKKTQEKSGLINEARFILQLPIVWSAELILIYALLMVLHPAWVSVPLHIYFLAVGTQTLYSYLKAKSATYRAESNRQVAVRLFSGVVTAATALCYVVYLVNDGKESKSDSNNHLFWWQRHLYWVSNDAIGYTLLIKLVATIQVGKFRLIALLFAAMICYDCFFVFGSDVMVTVATKVENPMKFVFPSDLSQVLTAQASSQNFSIIGFGDVFIPAILASLALRMDFIRSFNSVKQEFATKNGI